MKLRLHGTEDECRETAELLEQIMLIQSVSEPYPDRGRSVLVRVCLPCNRSKAAGVACQLDHAAIEAIPRGGR